MSTSTQTDSSKSSGSNGKSKDEDVIAAAAVAAADQKSEPKAEAKAKKPAAKVEEKKTETKDKSEVEKKVFGPEDVDRLYKSQVRIRGEKEGSDPIQVMVDSLGFVRRLIRDGHSNDPNVEDQIGVLRMAARAAFMSHKSMDSATAFKAAEEAMEDALLPPKFTVEKVCELMERALHNEKWIRSKVISDRRYSDKERVLLLKTLRVELCPPKRTVEEMVAVIDRAERPDKMAAEILGDLGKNLRYSKEELKERLEAATKAVKIVLVAARITTDGIENVLMDALMNGGNAQRRNSRPPQHRSNNGHHNSRPQGASAPKPRETMPNEGGGRSKRPHKKDRGTQAPKKLRSNKPNPQNEGRGNKKQNRKADIAAQRAQV